MILPITIYGNPVLRKMGKEIDKNDEGLDELIANMFETLDQADGVGLAAPQVGKDIRLFIIDAIPLSEKDESLDDFKKIFINAKIVERTGEEEFYSEACLSIPGIREDIKRHTEIRMQYYDENFELHDEKYSGVKARIIQHEYDHTDGKMFIDRLPPLKKRLLKRRLKEVATNKYEANYRTKLNKGILAL